MSEVSKRFVAALGAAVFVLWAGVAGAHHSAAQFDFSQRVTVEGVIKEFNVTNPHTMAIVEVTDEERGTRDIEFEGHSASHFYRAGYTRGMASPGDEIAILIAPRGDGEDGGFIQAFTVDGETVGFGGLSPETGRRTDDADICDRACLGEVMTRYLESLVANDPSIAPLAEDVRFTEDTVEMPVGEGLWKTASALGGYRTDFLDVREGTAAVHAVLEEQGSPVLFAARLRVEDREITEIETMVVRNAEEGVLFAPEALTAPSEAMSALPPESELDPRERMVEIAMRYPAGLRAGSFVTSDVPFAEGAYRLENGVRMAGPGCTFQPPSCEDILNQQIPTLPDVDGHVVAVDERNGTVLMRLDFGAGSLPGPDTAGQSLVTFEAFKVYDGQVHAVEAVFEGMPADTPSGWD